MNTHISIFIFSTYLLQFTSAQINRSTSTCSVPLCSQGNRSSSCSTGSQACYAYSTPIANQTLCAPSVTCSLFETCDNNVCASNTSICLSSTCCPRPICMPLILPLTTCNSTLPTIFPSQCYNHVVNTDETRNLAYTQTTSLCDSSEFSTGKWVRFSGMAGTDLATSVSSDSRCGTNYPGYLNDTLPTSVGQTKTSSVCFYYYGGCQWQSTIRVTNCLNYNVYYLTQPPTCNLRYCTV